MKTADGYTVKTSNGYPISVKSIDDYNYPLTCIISPQKIYTAVVDQ